MMLSFHKVSLFLSWWYSISLSRPRHNLTISRKSIPSLLDRTSCLLLSAPLHSVHTAVQGHKPTENRPTSFNHHSLRVAVVTDPDNVLSPLELTAQSCSVTGGTADVISNNHLAHTSSAVLGWLEKTPNQYLTFYLRSSIYRKKFKIPV